MAVWDMFLGRIHCPLKDQPEPLLYVTADTALFNHQPLGYFLINYSLL